MTVCLRLSNNINDESVSVWLVLPSVEQQATSTRDVWKACRLTRVYGHGTPTLLSLSFALSRQIGAFVNWNIIVVVMAINL